MQLQFVGCGDAFGSGGRFNTCFHITGERANLLVDCGASSLVAMKRFGIARDDIDVVLITHFHGDHFGGLPFLVLDAQITGRRRPLIIAGWMVYGAVYIGFAAATTTWQAWALFIAYGVYFGLTEGVEKALVADLVPASVRGAAFGWYNLTIGLAALPASLIFGGLWQAYGAPTAFTVGAGLALVASVGLFLVTQEGAKRGAQGATG